MSLTSTSCHRQSSEDSRSPRCKNPTPLTSAGIYIRDTRKSLSFAQEVTTLSPKDALNSLPEWLPISSWSNQYQQQHFHISVHHSTQNLFYKRLGTTLEEVFVLWRLQTCLTCIIIKYASTWIWIKEQSLSLTNPDIRCNFLLLLLIKLSAGLLYSVWTTIKRFSSHQPVAAIQREDSSWEQAEEGPDLDTILSHQKIQEQMGWNFFDVLGWLFSPLDMTNTADRSCYKKPSVSGFDLRSSEFFLNLKAQKALYWNTEISYHRFH